MKISATVAALIAALVSISGVAHAQSYPHGDADGLMTYGAWKYLPNDCLASAKTESDGGWDELSVQIVNQNGTGSQWLEFKLRNASVDSDYYKAFNGMLDKDARGRASITVDGKIFRAVSTTYSFEKQPEDEGAISVTFDFNSQSAKPGILHPTDPNVRVLEALKTARTITINFPDSSGTMVQAILTGKGAPQVLTQLRKACG